MSYYPAAIGPFELDPLELRIDADWIEQFILEPVDGEPPDIIDVEVTVRLSNALDPTDVLVTATLQDERVEWGDRAEDGSIPLIVRVDQTALAPLGVRDCRLDILMTRYGQTTVFATAIRRLRR